jgi:CDP-glucose 4,6-dehydratase
MKERKKVKIMLSIFKNSKVLITGHTGFKGVWLSTWLKKLGAEVYGIGLEPITTPSHFFISEIKYEMTSHIIDIRNREKMINKIESIQPDFVFHLAAQAIVSQAYIDPAETWETNVLGTLNVLEGLKKIKKKCIAVIITSDKCYENVEWIWGYRETDQLGGLDPYSASKAGAELLIKSYINSFFPKKDSNIRIATARAGNVIGGGDWSSNRIIPDCVRSWSCGNSVKLRNPHSTRPWQHVLEPLSGYLNLASALFNQPELHGEPFNFGPKNEQNHSVIELVKTMSNFWVQVEWDDISDNFKGPHEAGLLKLNCDKALHYLKWNAIMDFTETVEMTANWYREYYNSPNLKFKYTSIQIDEYVNKAKNLNIEWAV